MKSIPLPQATALGMIAQVTEETAEEGPDPHDVSFYHPMPELFIV